jgi:hypothetical protein
MIFNGSGRTTGANERFGNCCAGQCGLNSSMCRGPKGITATVPNRRYNSSARAVRWLLDAFFRSMRLVLGLRSLAMPWRSPKGTENVIYGTHDLAGRIRPEWTSSQAGSTWQKTADAIAANSQSVLLENPSLGTRLTRHVFRSRVPAGPPPSWREFGRADQRSARSR